MKCPNCECELELAKAERTFDTTQQEVSLVLNAVIESNWNLTEAAKKLGISRGKLYNKCKQYDIYKGKIANPKG